jgi:hypothetical protein
MKHLVLTLALLPALANAGQITMIPTGGTDGERKNAVRLSEQQLPVQVTKGKCQ